MEKLKKQGELQLNEKRAKVVAELQKLKQRADEFSDFSELAMVPQYLMDVRIVHKRLGDAQEQIIWINKEEALYKFSITQFPEVDEIAAAIDPYMKLFQIVNKWQKVEKKYVLDFTYYMF